MAGIVRSLMVEIGRLSAADVPLMRGLNALFAEAFEDPEHYLAAPPEDDYLERRLAHPHVIALVAIENEKVVGGLVAYELPKLEQARSEIYIYDLAVAEAHRRKGIATALIADLQSIAAECGAWVVYVQADYGDEPAIALYTKLGVREDVMHFDIPVPEEHKA
jgi:aminoglycoside 3-N-acetyltransferase I